MQSFKGKYYHNIDKKGRVFVPAKLRDALGSSIVISKSIDLTPCLFIYSQESWDELVEKINRQPYVKVATLQRHLFSGADDVEYDAQGRILIPSVLREYAKLQDSQQAVIIGASNRVEIWNPEEWEKVQNEINEENLWTSLTNCEI